MRSGAERWWRGVRGGRFSGGLISRRVFAVSSNPPASHSANHAASQSTSQQAYSQPCSQPCRSPSLSQAVSQSVRPSGPPLCDRLHEDQSNCSLYCVLTALIVLPHSQPLAPLHKKLKSPQNTSRCFISKLGAGAALLACD